MRILVINGVNMDMLGTREPDIYGEQTLPELEAELTEYGRQRDCLVECKSSNIEGEIVEFIHGAMGEFDGVILNAGAYSHYSIAIRDAISAIDVPVVEVHISNIYARDFFRSISITAPACVGAIAGLGTYGYKAALDFLCQALCQIQ